MKNSFFTLIFFGIILLVVSCSTQTEKSNLTSDSIAAVSKKYDTGKIIRTVSCEGGFDFSYSLFLPENYSAQNKYPLILFFDPHAAGHIPIEQYAALANKFGYVLAGSNDSKNGMNPAVYQQVYRATKNHLTKRFNIDGKRIYLAGFSGGGRVASGIALGDASIAGVISNSAGFDPSAYTPREGFVFIGIAGNEDFNLLEQRRTEKNLEPYKGVFHQLIEFDGKHEWAPEEEMENAFIFLECSAKKNHILIRNDSLLLKKHESLMAQLNEIKSQEERFYLLKKLYAYQLAGIASSETEKELNSLKSSAIIQRIKKEEEESEAREAVQQTALYDKLFTEEISWWIASVKQWNNPNLQKKEKQLNKRLQSYISLAVYMTIISPEAQNEIFLLEKLITIYELVDPQNPEWAYQKAVLRARQGNKKEAIQLLQICEQLKFSDKERIASQPEFSSLLQDSDFPSALR